MYKYAPVGDGEDKATVQGGGSDMAEIRGANLAGTTGKTTVIAKLDYLHYRHYVIGAAYICGLFLITVFWNSPSLVVLAGSHLMAVFFFTVMDRTDSIMADRILNFIFSGHRRYGKHPLKILSWHIHNPTHNWLNLLHLSVLLVNFVFFLNFIQNDMPPASIKFSDPQVSRDQSIFGSTGFASYTDPSKLSVVELAGKGYYQLEEYRGYIGQNNVLCGSQPDWRCFAVGVRTASNDGTLTSTWYQPLPSDAYDVDLQVAVGLQSLATPPVCPPVFVQHVTGQGNTMGAYKPIMDFAWDSAASNTFTPSGTLLGALSSQRQTYAQYTTSLQTKCSTTRTKHDDGGVKYAANYIPIPLPVNGGPVDIQSGGIRYTIVIMTNATYAPFIRVTPKHTNLGMPLEALFMPVTTWFFDDYHAAGVYGKAPPIPELAAIPFPSDYADRNYSNILFAHGLIFVVLICISWYYFITMAYGYDDKSPIYTSFFVRIPLMMLGIYCRSWIYATSQGTFAMLLLSYNNEWNNGGGFSKMGMNRKHPLITYFMFFFTLVFTLTHLIIWCIMVWPKANLLSFYPYLREMKMSNSYFPMGDMESSPMIPMLIAFLLIEPICTLVMYAIVIGRWLYRWGEGTFFSH